MANTQIQVKISLSPTLHKLVSDKAKKLGLPITQLVKHAVIKEVKEEKYPVYQASDATIRAYKKAMKEKDKAVVVEDLDEFFKNL